MYEALAPIYTDFATPTEQVDRSEDLNEGDSWLARWETVAPVPLEQIPAEAYGFVLFTSIVADWTGYREAETGEGGLTDVNFSALVDIGWRPFGAVRYVPGGVTTDLLYCAPGATPTLISQPFSALDADWVHGSYAIQDDVGNVTSYLRSPIYTSFFQASGDEPFEFRDPSWDDTFERGWRTQFSDTIEPFLWHRDMAQEEGTGGDYDREGRGHVWPLSVHVHQYNYFSLLRPDQTVNFTDLRLITVPYRRGGEPGAADVGAAVSGRRPVPHRVIGTSR